MLEVYHKELGEEGCSEAAGVEDTIRCLPGAFVLCFITYNFRWKKRIPGTAVYVGLEFVIKSTASV